MSILDVYKEISDIELCARISLRRNPFGYESWRNGSLLAARIAIRQTRDCLAKNSFNHTLIHPSLDEVIDYDQDFIRRAYQVLLSREPTEAEYKFWKHQEKISLGLLTSKTILSFEGFQLDGVAESADEAGLRNVLQVKANILNHNIYASNITNNIRKKKSLRYNDKGERSLRVLLNLFRISSECVNNIQGYILKIHGVNVAIEQIDNNIPPNSDKMEHFDLYITNNNYLGGDPTAHLVEVEKSNALSACWLWDNHHQFDLSARCTQNFDYVFPAHSNGQTYLHSSRSIVGDLNPCAVFQWYPEEASDLFSIFGRSNRSNELYGRFNSYSGLTSLRDVFLKEARSAGFASIQLSTGSSNEWNTKSRSDKFSELCNYKAMICTPIFNDVPARVFDTLLAGAIPIVPYGTPDIGLSFSNTDQINLPIIKYVPGNMQSLQEAVSVACDAFDSGGFENCIKRHNLIIQGHFIRHRISFIISSLIQSRQLIFE